MSRTYRRKEMAYFHEFGSEAATFSKASGEFKTWYMCHGDDYYFRLKPAKYWQNQMIPNEKDFKLFHSDKYKYCGNHYGKLHVDMNLECKVMIGRSTVRQNLKTAVRNDTTDGFIATDVGVKNYIEWY